MTHYNEAIPAAPRKPDWRDKAACRSDNTDRFFHTTPTRVQEAKGTCFGCPVMYQCAQGALHRGEENGVWGGLSEGQRTTIRKKYKIHQLQNLDTVKTAVDNALRAELHPERTLRDLWDQHTHPLPGGHIGWHGPVGSFSFHGIPVTPKQLAFQIDRGHKATGIIRRAPECPVVECVNPRHLLDNQERIQRRRAAEEAAVQAAAQEQHAADEALPEAG
ncbi:hypothetical protein AQI95_24830 [Streptomyces yokosukanensis]|uniref:Transcriptional regulator WhiB n=1 Tax=Streptomyces yokosukanensis TaxID=67386 RepID=A0A101P0P6_9ACTN|nr:WhiB family transcriptional regulator [Streptomyces yokosukanensis]KUN02770.1 hypothetical protein AQI95_24830 [Streptomyces yokosukanensis]